MTVNPRQLNNKNLTRAICCGFLLVLFAAVLFPVINSPVKAGLVYCPLQKTWVKPKSEVSNNLAPLKNFCATNKRKIELAAELALKIIDLKSVTENAVFDYLEKGNQVLVNNFPNLPKDEISKQTKLETAANNFHYDIIKLQVAKTIFPQILRPPNYRTSTKFDFQIVRSLEKISRSINPRSPPFST